MKQYDAGLNGENQAEAYLCAKGMMVIARRYRAQDGEIDLIMQDGRTIVFVEVKARPRGRAGDGLLAVTSAKQRRMTHAALSFLVEREWMSHPVRFDVVEITAQGIIHVPNAFPACM
ncbi:MAG: YraN family protein [Clostridia bacterium]|nr:YraN family protein [Clostridia bacterium]